MEVKEAKETKTKKIKSDSAYKVVVGFRVKKGAFKVGTVLEKGDFDPILFKGFIKRGWVAPVSEYTSIERAQRRFAEIKEQRLETEKKALESTGQIEILKELLAEPLAKIASLEKRIDFLVKTNELRTGDEKEPTKTEVNSEEVSEEVSEESKAKGRKAKV